MIEIRHRYTRVVLRAVDAQNLRGADLRGADLRGADLRGADLYDADLYGADLYGANLYDANLYDANLRGANLCGANLYGADLRGANLYGADLRGANLRGAFIGKTENEKLEVLHAPLYIGPLGSREDTLFVWATKQGIRLQTGCFFGTVEEFREKLAQTHAEGSEHRIAYEKALAFAEQEQPK